MSVQQLHTAIKNQYDIQLQLTRARAELAEWFQKTPGIDKKNEYRLDDFDDHYKRLEKISSLENKVKTLESKFQIACTSLSTLWPPIEQGFAIIVSIEDQPAHFRAWEDNEGIKVVRSSHS